MGIHDFQQCLAYDALSASWQYLERKRQQKERVGLPYYPMKAELCCEVFLIMAKAIVEPNNSSTLQV